MRISTHLQGHECFVITRITFAYLLFHLYDLGDADQIMIYLYDRGDAGQIMIYLHDRGDTGQIIIYLHDLGDADQIIYSTRESSKLKHAPLHVMHINTPRFRAVSYTHLTLPTIYSV